MGLSANITKTGEKDLTPMLSPYIHIPAENRARGTVILAMRRRVSRIHPRPWMYCGHAGSRKTRSPLAEIANARRMLQSIGFWGGEGSGEAAVYSTALARLICTGILSSNIDGCFSCCKLFFAYLNNYQNEMENFCVTLQKRPECFQNSTVARDCILGSPACLRTQRREHGGSSQVTNAMRTIIWIEE